ncbi:hypothetical protein K2173_011140 [Erythroxylum novogranatense]|uniref:Cytochrome c-552/DMSO reductase-like haem-binding domain-containing protein n=1 Tax=Erythroxylum novogranatense TaxID=1862640 RepID=A0AAV8UC85_9ROSI|nr:hypothetical protein K2173_011140 [Erythroxylum novogranatense]
MLPALLALLVLGPALTAPVVAHQESGPWTCGSDSGIPVVAGFNPGIVTVDGHAEDWKEIDGFEFPLLPALDPDADKEYTGGEMTVKAVHDGHNIYFLLQVDGEYAYTTGDNSKCPSVALMFQIGDDATYHRMGGCKDGSDTCTNTTCKGFEVDIMHFSIGNAIPGRLYGGNPIDNRNGTGGDSFGHLVDLYAWNPHCRYLDGIGPSGNDSTALNDWKGAWWHSSFTVHSGFVKADSPYSSAGKAGTYSFEFSRPLRTMDRLQQDAQFTIGLPGKMSVAFWYPVDGNPWHGSGHYSISCDWIPLDIHPARSMLAKLSSHGSQDIASAFSLLFSVGALCLSTFAAFMVTRSRNANAQFGRLEAEEMVVRIPQDCTDS